MKRGKSQDDGLIGCIAAAILGILFMPFVGIYFIASKDPEKKTLGWVLLIVGIILIVFLLAKGG